VESEEQLTEIARSVKESGASVLRGGAFKPRSSPYSFQGGGMPALRLLKRIGEKVGMPVVSEITSERDIERFRNTGIDMVQVGSRNAQNFALLKQLGRSGMPVMLKRGMGNKVEDWICAAEYLLSSGNGNVILCERGIATYENSTRFTLDIGGMAAAQLMTHLPVGADPSHAAGKSELVGPHALAAVAAGAKFIMVEVHDEPREAKCDAKQQLYPSDFAKLMRKAEDVAKAIGKTSAAQTAREVGYCSDLELSGGYRGPW
jgi:3-deoxy-7-phosphoheptulonate synthase